MDLIRNQSSKIAPGGKFLGCHGSCWSSAEPRESPREMDQRAADWSQEDVVTQACLFCLSLPLCMITRTSRQARVDGDFFWRHFQPVHSPLDADNSGKIPPEQ